MTVQELLDSAADQAMAGRQVDALAIHRALAHRRSRSMRRGVALVAACVLVLLPLSLLVATRWPGGGAPQPAHSDGRYVVPDVVRDLRSAPLLVDASGHVASRRLSMAFMGTVSGQLAPVGLDAATGRPFLLPVLSQNLPGVDLGGLTKIVGTTTPTLVSLSPDGRTVAVSHQSAWDAVDLVLDLTTGRITVVHQAVPDGATDARALAVAALDGGRFVVPADDLRGVRVGAVGGSTRDVRLPGAAAGTQLVVEAGPASTVLATGRHAGRDWMWQVDAATGVARGFAAPWVASSGWAGAASDGQGRLVSLVDGSQLVAHDLRSGASTDVGRVVLTGAAGVAAQDLRVVSASGGSVVLTDDGRQRAPRFVAGAEPHRLLRVGPSGALRTMTSFRVPRSEAGPAVSSLSVASDVVGAADSVTPPTSPWWQRWWPLLLGLVAVGLVVVALSLREGRSAATRQPWQHSGPPRM